MAAAIVTLAAMYTYDHAPSRPPTRATSPTSTPPPNTPPPQTSGLAVEFVQLALRMNATMGLVVTAIGDGQVTSYGDWTEGPAWSTIKVPLVIAAYRQQNKVTDQMKAAITESDNAAAEALWQALGDPAAAGRKVQQILQETGDPTVVQSQKVRKEFTAFGQTIWSLTNQAKFTANAFCNKQNDPIFALMGEIEPQQRWGIAALPGVQFKGGWGPSPAGKYLVRQIGVFDTPHGKTAVAIAAEPASGSFDDGRRALDEAATWLNSHLADLPGGQCMPHNPYGRR